MGVLVNYKTEMAGSKQLSGNKNDPLSHLSYFCPGLHGKDNRQDVKRMTFRQLLTRDKTLIIPIIQRRYCWNGNTVWQWFQDVIGGKRDHLGVHNTGNVVLKLSSIDNGYIVIDGQQRITTTTLFLAALGDEILKFKERFEDSETHFRGLLKEIDQCLFVNKDRQQLRLLPSFYDRKPFKKILFSDQEDVVEDEEVSYQNLATKFSSIKIQEEATKKKLSTIEDFQDFYTELAHKQLDLMGLTFCEILNEINLSQVFLWLQEKSLLGGGALVFNPAPGLFFTAVDMIRNVLLSPIMSKTMAEQEKLFLSLWSDPVESFFRGNDQENLDKFNKYLHQFVTQESEKRKYVSKAESTYIAAMEGMKSVSPKSRMYITTYAKFISIMEHVSKQLSKSGDDKDAMTEQQEEAAAEEIERQIKVSSFVSSKISNFIKVHALQETIETK